MMRMARIKVRKIYFKTDAVDDRRDIMANIARDMNPDLKACILSGIAVDVITDKNTIIVKTVNPVSLLKSPDGTIIHIAEMKPSHPDYSKYED